jgi:hypothetical protein
VLCTDRIAAGKVGDWHLRSEIGDGLASLGLRHPLLLSSSNIRVKRGFQSPIDYRCIIGHLTTGLCISTCSGALSGWLVAYSVLLIVLQFLISISGRPASRSLWLLPPLPLSCDPVNYQTCRLPPIRFD